MEHIITTKSKHTPGPWGIRKPKNPDLRQTEDRLIVAGSEDNRLHIAEVYQYQNHNNREANGTALANARLIAAAPETKKQRDALLVACKKAETALVNRDNDDEMLQAQCLCTKAIAAAQIDPS